VSREKIKNFKVFRNVLLLLAVYGLNLVFYQVLMASSSCLPAHQVNYQVSSCRNNHKDNHSSPSDYTLLLRAEGAEQRLCCLVVAIASPPVPVFRLHFEEIKEPVLHTHTSSYCLPEKAFKRYCLDRAFLI
jgi:hypothetical protein